MDALIRTLRITASQSVADVTADCAKLINWLQCHSYVGNCAKLSYKDIETMFKATLYLHNCFNIYGEELLLAMVMECPWARHQLEQYYAQYTSGTCIAQLCRQVIATSPLDGVHIAQIARLLQLLGDTELSERADEYLLQLSEMSTSNESEGNAKSDMNCMLGLVQRIFHIPGGEIQIERATRRMLLNLPFNLLGQLFKVDAKSPMYTRCSILAEIICKELHTAVSIEDEHENTEQSSKVAAHFIQAIYVHAAGTTHGLQFLWQCLAYQAFAHGLMQYLLDYYDQYLLHLDLECMQLTGVGATESQPPLTSVLFLTHALMSRKSPCYLEFFARIKETHYSVTFLALYNKLAYVFD